MDSKKRTIIKAMLWNALGFAVMSLVGFVATGSWALGGTMALVNTGVGFVVYLIYERIWAHVSWGRIGALR